MGIDRNKHGGYVGAWARANKGRHVRHFNREGELTGHVSTLLVAAEFGNSFYGYIGTLEFVDGNPAILPTAIIERSERWPKNVGAQGRLLSAGGDPEIFVVKGRSGEVYFVESLDFVHFLDEEELLRYGEHLNDKARQAAKSTSFSDAMREQFDRSGRSPYIAPAPIVTKLTPDPVRIAAKRAMSFICDLRPREIAVARERESVVRQIMEALAPGKGDK